MLHLKDYASRLLVNAIYASDDEMFLKRVINQLQLANGTQCMAVALQVCFFYFYFAEASI
jgi:hypothetical protein